MPSRKIFVNLPVKDLKKSVAFFSKLGFEFDQRFTDDAASCMIVSSEGFVMLMTEARFKDFTKRELSDRSKTSEGLFALSADSRKDVDTFADAALANGGTQAMPPIDHGFMYGRSFYDLDGHHWEIFHMDPTALEQK